ncbi:Pol Polyprotein [Phytophthora megakarya]|uniref:Pol Polyprotein n=1 Tax=Phytophthora megakarya TaxID=4795 RepID=A0A225WM17_9STRA|nr:Pol Polyprotein [Phytophthora megakarya]
MARWLSFFAEYNFDVKYKPGKQNALADALSHRPDYELAHVTNFCYVLSGAFSLMTLIASCLRDCAVDYIDIPSMEVCCTTAQIPKTHLV